MLAVLLYCKKQILIWQEKMKYIGQGYFDWLQINMDRKRSGYSRGGNSHIIDGVFYYTVFFRQIMVKYIFVE